MKLVSETRGYCQSISIPVYILVMLFAIASWIDINGLWVELPLLVEVLPESWDLPSYLIIIIQVANVGPLLYTVANKLAPNKVKEWPVIYLIICTGGIACLLLIFFWDHTVYTLGAERSIPLIVLTSCLALVDTTSSVVFLPYMAIFKPEYMIPYYIGEGLSGLIPGLVGLIQGVGSDPECRNQSSTVFNETTGENYTIYEVVPIYHPPLFSVEVFFVFLLGMLCVSGVSFTFLNFAPFCKREMVISEPKIKSEESETETYDNKIEKEEESETEETRDNKIVREDDVRAGDNKIHPVDSNQDNFTSKQEIITTEIVDRRELPRSSFIVLLVAIAWVNGLSNGVLPSTQSYSSLPYSNMVYTLSVRLSTVANPLACFIALFLPTSSVAVVLLMTFLGTILSAYQLALAALSPTPPLQDEAAGEALCIVTAVLLTGVFSYVKVSVASIVRHQGRTGLLWVGGITQVGSCIGAIVTFVLVNVYNVFTPSYESPCPS